MAEWNPSPEAIKNMKRFLMIGADKGNIIKKDYENMKVEELIKEFENILTLVDLDIWSEEEKAPKQ